MAKRGPKKPYKYTLKRRKELARLLKEYIEWEDMPILAEFAYKNGVPKSSLYDIDELSDLMEKCRNKKEAYLETNALKGKINPSMAIFSLKQLGWTDKVDTKNINGNINLDDIDESQIDDEIKKIEKVLNARPKKD